MKPLKSALVGFFSSDVEVVADCLDISYYLLFNLNTSHLPQTSRKFAYADDMALAFQGHDFETLNRKVVERSEKNELLV